MNEKLENKLNKIEKDISIINVNIQEGFKETEKKLIDLKIRINDTYNAVDGFIKVVTKLDQEFTVMKKDVDRIKKVIKEKLDVDLF